MNFKNIEKTVGIDGDLYKYIFAARANKSTFNEKQLIEYVTTEVEELINSIQDCYPKIEYFVWATTSSNLKRKELYPEYKGKRKKSDLIYLDQINNILNSISYCIPGYEADDILAEIGKLGGVICTRDKDLLQVPGRHFYTEMPLYVSEAEANKSFLLQLLKGDNVDNIPGIPRVGDKKALKYYNSYIKKDIRSVFKTYLQKGLNREYFNTMYYLLHLKLEGNIIDENNVLNINEWKRLIPQQFGSGQLQ